MVLSRFASLNAVCGRRTVEINGLLLHLVAELAQWADVIQDPKRASVCGDDEIVVLHYEIVHWSRRQIQFERPPIGAVVERNVNAILRARVKQSALLRVFADRSHETAIGYAIRQLRPGLTVVAGFVDVGPKV